MLKVEVKLLPAKSFTELTGSINVYLVLLDRRIDGVMVNMFPFIDLFVGITVLPKKPADILAIVP